jgi:hypothetical protein
VGLLFGEEETLENVRKKMQISCYYIGFYTLILPRKYLVGRVAYGEIVNWVVTVKLCSDCQTG